MNDTQAAQAMATMSVAYNRTVDPEAMQLWFNTSLQTCTLDVARLVVERIVNEDQFFPTPARFNEVRRAVERSMEPTYAALPVAPPTPDQHDRVKAHIATARELIANAKTPQRRA